MTDSREGNRKAIATLRRYGRAHRSAYLLGLFGSIAVAACRIALPWPLRGIIEAVFPGSLGSKLTTLFSDGGSDPVPAFVALFIGIALAAVLFGKIQRVYLRRFASRMTHDLRTAAVRNVLRGPETEARSDRVGRIVADSARLSAAVPPILGSLPENGLLVAGVCILLLILAPLQGLLLLAGVMISMWILSRARAADSSPAPKQEERKESPDPDLDPRPEDREAGVPDHRGAHGVVHAILAIAVGLGLWAGVSRVDPGLLFLLVVYGLTLQRPIVQIGRQVARCRRVSGPVGRITAPLGDTDPDDTVAPAELKTSLRFENVRLAPLRKGEERARFKADTIVIHPGERVAVIGGEGDGKSSLLRMIAGREPLASGTMMWDDTPLPPTGEALAEKAAFLPQDPVFSAAPVWKLLGLESAGSMTPEQGAVLQAAGTERLIQRLPGGLNAEVDSTHLSRNQARAIALAAILLGKKPIWVLDVPLDGLSSPRSRSRLNAIFHGAKGRTLVMSLSRTSSAKRFDRVIALRRGRIRFQGTVQEWRNWKAGGSVTDLRERETSSKN